jgi:hypothetical protein
VIPRDKLIRKSLLYASMHAQIIPIYDYSGRLTLNQ